VKKKRKQNQSTQSTTKQSDERLTLKDQLSESVFTKLLETKSSLTAEQQRREEEEQAKKLFEKKQREKNMSFEELLDQYGEKGSKF